MTSPVTSTKLCLQIDSAGPAPRPTQSRTSPLGVMGEERTKRLREDETAEISRKVPRTDQDSIVVIGDEVYLAGAKDDGLSNAVLNVVKGLPNFGYTCYLNALVQCLLALGKSRTLILRPDAKLGLMGMALKDLFVKTNVGYPGEFMDPALFTACVRAWDDSFKGKEMHDSQELFLSLLRCLGNEEKEEDEPSKPPHMDEGISSNAIIDLIFGGEICYKKSCRCSNYSLNYMPFTDLGLPLPAESCLARNAARSMAASADLTGAEQIQQYKDRAQNNQLQSLASIDDCLKLLIKAENIDWCCSSTDRSKAGEHTKTSCHQKVSVSCSTTDQKPENHENVQ